MGMFQLDSFIIFVVKTEQSPWDCAVPVGVKSSAFS